MSEPFIPPYPARPDKPLPVLELLRRSRRNPTMFDEQGLTSVFGRTMVWAANRYRLTGFGRAEIVDRAPSV